MTERTIETMTTPTRPTDRIAAGLAASAEKTAVPATPLTSTQDAYRLALKAASDRGERLSPNQRMTLGLLTAQHDAAATVTA